MIKISKILLIFVISFFFINAQAVQNDVFTPRQKAQIEEMIHTYLIQHPEVLIEASEVLQQRKAVEQQEMIKKAAQENMQTLLQSVRIPFTGNPNGQIVLIEFFDYRCGHCREMSLVIDKLLKANKNLKVIFRELPIFGSESLIASKATLAANLQNKYLMFHRHFMTSQAFMHEEEILALAKEAKLDVKKFQKDRKSASIAQMISDNQELAKKLHITGTPMFIIVQNDVSKKSHDPHISVVIGSVSQEALQKIIDDFQDTDD